VTFVIGLIYLISPIVEDVRRGNIYSVLRVREIWYLENEWSVFLNLIPVSYVIPWIPNH